jgi:hypothetical protein
MVIMKIEVICFSETLAIAVTLDCAFTQAFETSVQICPQACSRFPLINHSDFELRCDLSTMRLDRNRSTMVKNEVYAVYMTYEDL